MLPVAVLRDRVTRFRQQKRTCRLPEVATDLPGLIRDLHTTLATGADHGELPVSIAEGLHPERNPFPTNRTYHWVGYGRALARLRGRH